MMKQRTKPTRPRRLALGALVSVTLLGAACAAPPKPKIVQQAENRISHSDTEELTTLQPRLLREAKSYEIEARQAYKRRELDRARLYAHLALQRYETARNFVERDSARMLVKNMKEANTELAAEEQALSEERREMERFRELQDRFSSVRGELEQVREDLRGAAAQAKRLLLQARTRQAEALGAGASSVAPREYAEARLLVESALEAYDAQLYDEASASAREAISNFDGLIERSAESARAKRKAEAKAAEQRATREVDEDKARVAAQEAIDAATEAQTAAIGAQMATRQEALYEQGVFLLQSAERRLREGNYTGAEAKAQQSRETFLQGARADDANVSGAQATGASYGSAEVAQAIQRAEDARAAALARGASGPGLQRGDYALELARQAAQRDEPSRALQKAAEAAAAYEGLMGSQLAQAPGAGSGEDRTTPRRRRASGALAERAEEMIVGLQLDRAEALGQMKDERCPGAFREFEAVLELAQQRQDAGDHGQAFEFAVRASERLGRCDVSAAAATAAASEASGPRKPTPEERAEKARRESAADALSQAQGDYAELSVEVPEDPRLRRPAVLIGSAEQWFNQRDYAQAEKLSERAIEAMEELRDELDKERAVSEAVARKEASRPDPEAGPEEGSEGTTTDERLRAACRRVDGLIEQAKATQLRASRRELSEPNQERYRRGTRSLTRARALRREEVCESAEIIAQEAVATFEELASTREDLPRPDELDSQKQPESTTSTKTDQGEQTEPEEPDTTREPANERATTRPPETTPAPDAGAAQDPAQEAAASEAIAKARLAKARVADASNSNVFATADSLLREAERLNRQGQWAKAEGLARQAAGAFKSLDDDTAVTDDQGRQVDPNWKPAYSKVLDALIRRDEVTDEIGEPERDVFARGKANLQRSRTAWESDDFLAASKFAEAARDDFDEALEAAEARRDREEQKEQAAKEQAAKEQAAKEQAAKEQAAKTEAAKTEAAKTEAAKQKTQQRRAAEDALRAASVAKEVCQKERCDLRDERALFKANETYKGAEQAMKAGDYARASELASEATQTYEQIQTKPRGFLMPDGVTRVSRVGGRLKLNPRVKFQSGGTTIVAESLQSLDDLSKVLRENEQILESVSLVGYTDSRGNDKKNQELSQRRAAAVRQALVDRGVSDALLSSEGRGEANPIASNDTSEGRELNRRVEVIIKLKEGSS